MLDSNSRRPGFDAFFASLEVGFRDIFMAEALEQLDHLRETETGPHSLIDCMENKWDEWVELRHVNPTHYHPLSMGRSIMACMLDPEREARERHEKRLRNLPDTTPRSQW